MTVRRTVTLRRKLGVVATAVAVVLGTGYPVTVARHTLEAGHSSYRGPQAQLHEAGPFDEYRYVYTPGQQVTFGTSIRNPGPWPVTITDVALEAMPKDQSFFKVTSVTALYTNGRDGVGYGPSLAVPFQATKVAMDAELGVFLTVTIPDEPVAAGTGHYFNRLWVGYQVLGVTRHQWVPMRFYVTFQAGEG